MIIRNRPRCLAFLFAVCAALVAGCSNDSRPEKPAGPSPAAADFPPVMSGSEIFAGGKISVEVTLALPPTFHPGRENGPRGNSSPSGRRSDHRNRTGAGGPPGSGDRSEGPSDHDRTSPSLWGSNLPPAQLRLHLQNTSATDTVSCEVVDFNSVLGNFAVFPSRYEIEVGQSASSETMTSRLGVEGDEIPVTVALRVHDHVEKKVLTLHPRPTASKPAPVTTGK